MKVIVGVILGTLMTYLSLQYDYDHPVIFQLPSEMQAFLENVIAITLIEDTDAGLKKRQKSVAILIKNDSNYYVEIDNAIGNRFTNEAVEKIVRRKLSIIKNYDAAFNIAFEKGGNQALRDYLERKYETNDLDIIKERMVMEEIRKDLLVYNKLKKLFPGYSDEKIAHIILVGGNSTGQAKPDE